MWCPNCGIEYRTGFSSCADCGGALVEGPASEGDPIAVGGLEPCLDSGDRGEIAALIAELEASGVPYVLQAGTALSLLDGERLFAGRSAGAWEGRVWVHAPRLAEASRLLATVRSRHRDAAATTERELPEPREDETLEEFERRLGRA